MKDLNENDAYDPDQRLVITSCIEFTATCCDFYRLRGVISSNKNNLNYHQLIYYKGGKMKYEG